MKTFLSVALGVLLAILLSLAFTTWVGSAQAQGGTWRLTLYDNGNARAGGVYSSYEACEAAGLQALFSGRAKRYVCQRMGNGGIHDRIKPHKPR